jgi:phage gp46-like protein
VQAHALEANKALHPDAAPVDNLAKVSVLLAGLTQRERVSYRADAFTAKPAGAQLVLFHRAVQGQVFLARQAQTIADHEAWCEKQYAAHALGARSTTPAEKEAFYKRLMADTERRAAVKAAALSEKAAREAAILKTSKLWAISEKLCRKP